MAEDISKMDSGEEEETAEFPPLERPESATSDAKSLPSLKPKRRYLKSGAYVLIGKKGLPKRIKPNSSLGRALRQLRSNLLAELPRETAGHSLEVDSAVQLALLRDTLFSRMIAAELHVSAPAVSVYTSRYLSAVRELRASLVALGLTGADARMVPKPILPEWFTPDEA